MLSNQGTGSAVGKSAAANNNSGIAPQYLLGIIAIILTIVMAFIMSNTEGILAPLWLLAALAGFTLQRSRFCFASAFRDLFLFGSARTMKGILIGLAVATVGFAIIMYGKIPSPEYGYFPGEANILPVGISTITAGLLFGLGMVIAGGCVSGSLYRMAEGYLASWVTIIGIIIGLGLSAQTWNWWWENVITNEPRVWLPGTLSMGYAGGLFLMLLGLLLIYLLVVWWESRAGISIPNDSSTINDDESFRGKLSNTAQAIFRTGWSPQVGGTVLGGISVLMYVTHMPWGVTGELTRLSHVSMNLIGFPVPTLLGLDGIGGCTSVAGDAGIFTHPFAATVGLIPGAFIAALLSKEFKIRKPSHSIRYVQSLGGGLIMGYGAGLGFGCTIGAFFSSIASLSASGLVFGLALAIGAFLGVQVIKKIS